MENQEIEKVTWSTHIRMRPAMYIGDLYITGFKQILEYFLEELLKDALSKPVFEIEFHPSNRFEFSLSNIDTRKFISRIEELKLHEESLKSFGLATLLSLNSNISIEINELTGRVEVKGSKGNFEIIVSTTTLKEKKISIDYTPDNEIFKGFTAQYDHVNDFLKQFAFLNPGLKIISVDKTTDELQRNIYYYPKGIFEQLDLLISQQPFSYPMFKLNIKKDVDGFSYQVGFCYTTIWNEISLIRTFAGNRETYLGGSLYDGVFDGLIKSIKYIAEKENCAILISKKIVKEYLILIAAVRGENLIFDGSVKRKLGMPKLRKAVKEIVFTELTSYFQSNPEIKKHILYQFRPRD